MCYFYCHRRDPRPSCEGGWVNTDIYPSKEKFKDLEAVEIDKDYGKLVNSVQRHIDFSYSRDDEILRFNQ